MLFLLPAVTLPFLSALVYFLLLAGTLIANVIYAATKVFILLWPFIVVVGIERVTPRTKGVDWHKHFRAVPLGFLLGAIILITMVVLIEWTVMGDYVRGHGQDILKKVEDFRITTRIHYLLFGGFMCGAHSLLEEYYWRWFVYGKLSQICGPGWAMFWASLAFASHHYVVLWKFFGWGGCLFFGTTVGVGGALWCWLYRRQDSLFGAWTCHLLVDVAIFYIGYRLIF